MYIYRPHKQNATQGQFFKQNLTGLKSVFLLLDWMAYLW